MMGQYESHTGFLFKFEKKKGCVFVKIELEDAIYESFLQHAQIEVTGKCNMHCKHCRAVDEANRDLTLDEIEKILDFINMNREDNFRITLSGGEPFVHPNMIQIVKMVRDSGID